MNKLPTTVIVHYLQYLGMTTEQIASKSGIDEKTILKISSNKPCNKRIAKKLANFVDRIDVILPSKTLAVRE